MSKASVSGGKDGLYDATIEMKDGTPFVSPVHCADLTEDLSGNVGILEIAGALDKGFNIQPGYEGNAVYNAARDGAMKQIRKFPDTKPTGEVYHNWALFPGWQKWHRPAYRYGTITHVYTGADTCDVTLDPCYATDTPDGKQLNINPDDLTLGNVPIEYMDCDSAAFSDDDRVIVRFDGPLVVADPWGSPKVIGFTSEPKGCGFKFKIIRDDAVIIGDDWASDEGRPSFDDWGFVPCLSIKNSLGSSKTIYYGDQDWWDSNFPEEGWTVPEGASILTYDSETQYWSFLVPDEIKEGGGYWVSVSVADSITSQFVPPDGETASSYVWRPVNMHQEKNLSNQGTYDFPVALWRAIGSSDPDEGCPDVSGCTSQGPGGGVAASPYSRYVTVESSVPYKVRYLASGETGVSYFGNYHLYNCSRNSCSWCEEQLCDMWVVDSEAGWATIEGGGVNTMNAVTNPLDEYVEHGAGGGEHTITATFTGPNPRGGNKICCSEGEPTPCATLFPVSIGMACWSQGFSISASVNYD
ncbi:MAG: hypothetical protein JRD68_16120 [Deltaproteobacteria bacterium]|nr:hypothetical protein [Deltaproteobacteria bacterium]